MYVSNSFAAYAAAREFAFNREIQNAQNIVDASAQREKSANNDFYDLLEELSAMRSENIMLKSALEESDNENLRLSIQIGKLRKGSSM